MAVLAISALGAAAGAAIGGTFLGVTAASWGWMAGSMLGNALFAKDAEGPRLGDLRVTGSEYGQPVPWVAGSPRIAGQIIWASQKRETATSESAKGGPEVTTYTYDCDLVILLTENPILGVSRIWSNSELVFGAGLGNNQGMDGDLPTSLIKSGVCSGIRIYTGTDDQLPDPTYEAAVGVGNAPAYRGRGYVVITGLQLGGGGQIPNLTFEIGASPVDEYFDQVQLLLHFESVGGNWLYDSSSYHRIPAYSGIAEQSSTIIQFGNSGRLGTIVASYDAVARYDMPSSASRDFCIEFTLNNPHDLDYYYGSRPVQITQGSSKRLIIDLGLYTVEYGCRISYQINETPMFLYGRMNSPSEPIIFKKGMTHKLAVQFDSVLEQTRFYIDGMYIGGINESTFTDEPYTLYIGMGILAYANPVDFLYDEFRITHGIRYGESSYSTATEPFPDAGGAVYAATLSGHSGNLMQRAGYSEDEYLISEDISAKPLRAMAIGQVSATRGLLESLQTAFFFEASKSDKIYIRPRAETAIVTIPWVDLGCASDPATGEDALSLVLANDLEVPAQVALSYPSMEQDYQTATEHSDRIFSGQESTQTVQLGIGMTSAEAKGVADAIVFDLAASQTKATLRVPLKYAYVEPGDIVNAVNFDGRTYRLRVQTKRDTLSIIDLECVLDDVGALQSASITDGDYISVTEPVTVEQTEFEALDIPILRDADNSPGYYMAVGPVITNPDNYEWKGAQVVRSWNGTDYAELFQTTGAGVLGDCSNTLGNWTGGNVYDETNTLTVVTTGGELSSRTREAMQLDGTLNVAAVGSQVNGWEIIRFRNATLTGTNTYVLTGLHRGFRGTELAIGGHGAGEQFVLLDSALRRVTTQTSQIGLLRHIKAATFGLRLADVTAENFTDTGVALKPFAPANPVALADGADVVVSWQRRTRVSYVYGGATPSVPVGESVESYRVRIFDGSTLVRTEVVLSPEYTYASADISSDGFAPSDTITFEICQISEIVGAGYPAECEGIAP